MPVGVNTDYLDKVLLFRREMFARVDCLSSLKCVYVILLIKKFRRGDRLKIHRFLRKIKRTISYQDIDKTLEILVIAGFIRKGGGKGAWYYITEPGKWALKEFNSQLAYANFTKKSAAKRITKHKMPKLI